MPPPDSPERLHYLIIRHVIDAGHAPTLAPLAALAELTEESTEALLRKLAKMHGVILAPNSLRICSIHAFALNPTTFWVRIRTGGWWANCAWCALAIGAALQQDVNITTSDGGEGDAPEVKIERGRVDRAELLMNFPYPPERWWDNPLAPCVNILFFSSQTRIESWRARHGHPQGSALPIDTAIRLAELWFGDYASPDWVRKTLDRANEIFTELGLDRSFWKLPCSFR